VGVNLADTPTCVSEQVINIEDAVYAYTMGSAYATFCEDNRGSTSPGKYADPVVLSQDVYRIDPDRIKATNIDLTMIDGGEIAYSRSQRLVRQIAPRRADPTTSSIRRPLIASCSIEYVPRNYGTATSV
jgi:Amidohydrolase family